MPVFQLTSPSGEKYKVTAPEGATAEQAFEFFKQSNPDLFAAPEQTAPKFQPEKGSLEGMPRPRRVQRVPSAMAMKEVTEAAGGPAEFYGQTAKAFGRDAVKYTLGAPGEILSALNTINPGRLLGIVPELPEQRGLPTAEDIGQTFGFKQTPAEYSGAGFLGSLAGPSAAGTVAGGGARAVTAARNALQNFKNAKLADYLAAAEGKGPEIINYLQNAQELVPGSQPTAAQALAAAPQGGANYTRFIGLQPQGGKIPDELISAYDLRGVQQAEARAKSLEKVAGTPLSKEMAEGQRLAKTEPMFEAARESTTPVDIGNILDRVDNLIATNPGNPRLVKVLGRFRKGVTIPETPVTPELARTNAKELASALDGLKTELANEKNKFIKRELTELKDQLTAAIPGMEEAQTTFANLSKPINEMEIGETLKKTLTGTYAGTGERAGAFATKLSDIPKTVKTSTGMTARTLEEAGVSKQNVDRINKVMEDLNRSALAEERLAAAGSTMSKNPDAPRPNLMMRTVTAFNEVVAALVDRVGRKKALEIATEMLDPQIAAKVLEQAVAMEKTQAARAAAAARVGPAIRNVGTAAVPINALAPQNQNRNSLAGQ